MKEFNHLINSNADYYNNLNCWGKVPNAANLKRVEQTISLIPQDAHTILDLGCGDGMVSNPLVEKGRDVTGVDISAEAMRFFKGKKVPSSVDCLPFPDRSFDLVLCTEVLEHLSGGIYEKTLREIERITGKYAIISTPNEEYLPAGFAKCSACGQVFHVNLHFRTFNKAGHKRLFRELKLTKTIENNYWKHSPLMTSVKYRLGVYLYREGLI